MRSNTPSSMATVANRYRVNPSWKRTGGMGVVYRAWDLLDQCYVVIKSPRDHHDLKVDRFLRELSVMRRIDDPHVIQVKDSGVFGEIPFAVFPYLAGGDLQRRLPRSRGNRVPAPAEALKPWLATCPHEWHHVFS